MVVFFVPPCPLYLLFISLPPGLESLVHRKRAEGASCNDLYGEVFCVRKAELPRWNKVFKGFWHILTFNIMVEPMLGHLTSGLVKI